LQPVAAGTDCSNDVRNVAAPRSEAGLSRADVKIVILRTRFPDEYHAVAAARVNEEWLILDNRSLMLVRDIMIRAIPEVLFDEDGMHPRVTSARFGRGLRVRSAPQRRVQTNCGSKRLRFHDIDSIVAKSDQFKSTKALMNRQEG
jgi:hypothetical protein